VLSSLASQAGVALENKTLLESIENLFEQFVRASSRRLRCATSRRRVIPRASPT